MSNRRRKVCAALDTELHAALAAFDAAAAPWGEALEDLDEDVLADAAAEARAFGAGPAAAVDELVRGPAQRPAAVDRRAGPRAHHGN